MNRRWMILATLLAAFPAAHAQGVNVDFGTVHGVPPASYGAASSQDGTWNQTGLGVTVLDHLFGVPSGVSVNVVAGTATGTSGGAPTSSNEYLLGDNFYDLNGAGWSADLSGLADGDYQVFLYAPTNPAVPTGAMIVGGIPVAGIPGDAGSALIEGTSWLKVKVTVTGGGLVITGGGASFSGLAGLQVVPLASGLNLDFGLIYGVPAASYGAASGQAGSWNEVGLGVTGLFDLAGMGSGASVTVVATSELGGTPPGSSDVERLLNDNFFSGYGATSWSVDLSGLADRDYLVFLYAPSNSTTSTGAMTVGGVPVADISGDEDANLIEGASWVKAKVTVTDGTLAISGTGAGATGLAGLQVVPHESGTPGPKRINVDFGAVGYGVPAASYGAASGQAGSWNEISQAVTTLVDLSGATSAASARIIATSTFAGVPTLPSNDDERLLHDHFYHGSSETWNVFLSGVADGEYLVFLYAPTLGSTITGDMVVGGVPVASIPGHSGATLIEGTSWAEVQVTVTGGFLAISGSATGFSGLAGLQLVPFEPQGVNIDFGTAAGVPAASYGAASGQAGSWNLSGLSVTTLVDLSGVASGASVSVVAVSGTGTGGGTPTTDDELLLNDNVYSSSGAGWSADLSGLELGDYLVFLYAPSNSAVPTGAMTVGGVAVAGIPGETGSALIEGTSWVTVKVAVTSGTLAISGAGPGFSGIAGLQLVPLSGPENYCTAGLSASGCQATLSAAGTASATASSGFDVMAANVEGDKDGLFFFGTGGRQANPWGNGTSFQCIVPPVKRAGLLAGTGTPGACEGSFSQDMNARWCPTCPRPLHNPGAGALVQAQLWYRDPFNTSNQTTSLSDAIEFFVAP
jgi:hypothetical protein